MQNAAQQEPLAPDAAALRAMYAARKQVFVDLLKWDLPVLAGAYEIDQFDNHDAEYLILLDQEDGRHRASARLLQTDRPHILADLYPVLCDAPRRRGRPCARSHDFVSTVTSRPPNAGPRATNLSLR